MKQKHYEVLLSYMLQVHAVSKATHTVHYLGIPKTTVNT